MPAAYLLMSLFFRLDFPFNLIPLTTVEALSSCLPVLLPSRTILTRDHHSQAAIQSLAASDVVVAIALFATRPKKAKGSV